DYDEEYEQDDVYNHSEDPLASAMLLLAKAITQNFSNPTNNRLRASSNTRNQAVVQGDRVNIQNRNSGNAGRNNRRAYVQGEVVEGLNATNETANVQRIVRTPTLGTTSTGQCYNCGGKGHYARNYPKPRVRDSKYFMEQMLLAKKDEAGVILSDEQNDFLFADVSRMEEIEELTPKTRFSEKATQSKTLDTTSVASKSKIDEVSASKARDKVRIEKTKRSKNDQKPTRNGKKTKSQEQDKEISQKSQPDQPDT
ncbi:gag-pol polyprotein, partial [Tanacetum coccineum]